MRVMSKWVLVVVALLYAASGMLAQNVPNFSGNFSLVPDNPKKPSVVETLAIEQTATSIQITKTVDGKTEVEKYMLDGSTNESKTITGVSQTGFVKWHGSELWIETIATPSINGRIMRLHTKERWQLSKDSDTIKVRMETDAPDMPAEVSSAAFQPYVDVFKRTK